jgi:hypothetical protein
MRLFFAAFGAAARVRSQQPGCCDAAINSPWPLWFCERWLDLENFMRIFRQQGHPGAREKIWFSIKSIFDRIPARAANRRAGTRTMFLQTPKFPEPGRGAAQPMSISLGPANAAWLYPVRPSTRHHVG